MDEPLLYYKNFQLWNGGAEFHRYVPKHSNKNTLFKLIWKKVLLLHN